MIGFKEIYRIVLRRIHCSVASSARSPCANRTGVVCVWKPVMDFGLPACPTTSTACEREERENKSNIN